MKKFFSLLFVAGALSIISCGPSAEEKAKIEAEAKAKMDSLFNAASAAATTEMAAPDSMKKDSMATAPAEEKK
ncbi:MAG: hypothetical protein ACJ77K_10715 [Bacteroidia bacterium]